MPFVNKNLQRPLRIAALGECMLELSHQQHDTLRLRYAGDTFNSAVYIARYAHHIHAETFYITALGQDPYSDDMLNFWRTENIDARYVPRLAGKMPGLYFIRTDDQGERTFYYYRQNSAAREMLQTPHYQTLCEQLTALDLLLFSGISLAILDDASRERLLTLLQQLKKSGCRIAFDSNYRPKLWHSREQAQATMQAFLPLVDIALLAVNDEANLFGDVDYHATLKRLASYHIREIVLKQDSKPCIIYADEKQISVAPQAIKNIVDTTAAGDSFNAAYLIGRIHGLEPEAAAHCGHQLAGAVIQHPGALIAREHMPMLF